MRGLKYGGSSERFEGFAGSDEEWRILGLIFSKTDGESGAGIEVRVCESVLVMAVATG